MINDVIIVGGGPAAMSAALYLLRSGKKVLLLEKEAFGGQIAKSPRLENYPSIKSISGLEWTNDVFDQITALGAEFELDEVKEIKKENDVFHLAGEFGNYEAKAVILATGVEHRKLGLPREEELVGHGISYCAVCDGEFFAGKDVLLIGDANTALQYALLLADKCLSVTICTLFDHFFADQILIDRVKSNPRIKYFHNLNAKEYKGENELTSVIFEDTKTHEKKEFECAGAFIAIGQIPNNENFSNVVDLEKGFIITNEKMETKTPGLFAAGDCRVKDVRQVVTAVNDGAIAALSAANYLNTL